MEGLKGVAYHVVEGLKGVAFTKLFARLPECWVEGLQPNIMLAFYVWLSYKHLEHSNY